MRPTKRAGVRATRGRQPGVTTDVVHWQRKLREPKKSGSKMNGVRDLQMAINSGSERSHGSGMEKDLVPVRKRRDAGGRLEEPKVEQAGEPGDNHLQARKGDGQKKSGRGAERRKARRITFKNGSLKEDAEARRPGDHSHGRQRGKDDEGEAGSTRGRTT